jgi:hypothetical protein
VITEGDYALYKGDDGDYGDDVIPYNPKLEPCPYRTPEKRAEWHAQHGIEDPEKLPKDWKRENLEAAKKRVEDNLEGTVEALMPILEEVKREAQEVSPPPSLTKEQRYRLRNKEKLAARARERRAGKK